MYWFPFAILAKKALDAAVRYDEKQSARFRCRICWTNNHTTEEHRHPQLNARRRSILVKCQIALRFFLATWVGEGVAQSWSGRSRFGRGNRCLRRVRLVAKTNNFMSYINVA